MKVLYSKEHIRIEQEGDTVKLGIALYAYKRLNGIIFVNLPCAGDELKIGERFGDIESTKTVSDLISPMAGRILRVNEVLEDDPELLSEGTWIIEAEADAFADGLMAESEYLQYTKNL